MPSSRRKSDPVPTVPYSSDDIKDLREFGELSNRIAVVEKNQLGISARLQSMIEQFMLSQLDEHQARMDVAGDAVEHLQIALIEIHTKLETVQKQKLTAKEEDLFALSIFEDILENRYERTLLELDRAKITKTVESKVKQTTATRLDAVKSNPIPNITPPPIGSWQSWFQNVVIRDVVKAFLLLLAFEVMRSGIVPLLVRTFNP